MSRGENIKRQRMNRKRWTHAERGEGIHAKMR